MYIDITDIHIICTDVKIDYCTFDCVFCIIKSFTFWENIHFQKQIKKTIFENVLNSNHINHTGALMSTISKKSLLLFLSNCRRWSALQSCNILWISALQVYTEFLSTAKEKSSRLCSYAPVHLKILLNLILEIEMTKTKKRPRMSC